MKQYVRVCVTIVCIVYVIFVIFITHQSWDVLTGEKENFALFFVWVFGIICGTAGTTSTLIGIHALGKDIKRTLFSPSYRIPPPPPPSSIED